MAIPNRKTTVQKVYDQGRYNLATLEGCGQFTRDVCMALHQDDSKFLMLKKPEGRTHVVDHKGRRHAADAVVYEGTSVDIVIKSRTADAKPGWTPDERARYSASDVFAPDYAPVVDQPPPPPPPSDSAVEARLRALEDWAIRVQQKFGELAADR